LRRSDSRRSVWRRRRKEFFHSIAELGDAGFSADLCGRELVCARRQRFLYGGKGAFEVAETLVEAANRYSGLPTRHSSSDVNGRSSGRRVVISVN